LGVWHSKGEEVGHDHEFEGVRKHHYLK